MTDYKHIRLEAILWAKIDHLKGAKSFSGYVGSMLKYFEITGINPDSLQAPLAQETKNGIERIVRIIKAIEKEKLNRMLHLLENWHKEPQTMVDGINESQLLEVVNLNEELKKKVDKLQIDRDTLLNKNRDLNSELSQSKKNDVGVQVDIDGLKAIADKLRELEPESGFSTRILLSKEYIDNLANRITNSIKDVCQST